MIKRVLVDARWIGLHGIGRFAEEVIRRLPEPVDRLGGFPLLHPLEPIWTSFEIARRRPRVFYSPGFNVPLHSAVPMVFTIHDLIHLEVPEERSVLRSAYYAYLVRPATRRAARILTVSEFSKQTIVDWAGVPADRVVVVGNGVGPEFNPGGDAYDPGYPYLLHVGTHKPHRNLPRMLAAFARARLGPEVRLVLTGTPSKRLVEEASALGLEGRVVYAGCVSESMLPAYYRGARAVVLVSTYEGFGLPALEAMACGTPVVASNVSALPEVLDRAGLLVDPYNVESMADAFRKVVEDEGLRSHLRTLGLDRATRYSWDHVSAAVWQVLAEAS